MAGMDYGIKIFRDHSVHTYEVEKAFKAWEKQCSENGKPFQITQISTAVNDDLYVLTVLYMDQS